MPGARPASPDQAALLRVLMDRRRFPPVLLDRDLERVDYLKSDEAMELLDAAA
jgi:hypothetical protein